MHVEVTRTIAGGHRTIQVPDLWDHKPECYRRALDASAQQTSWAMAHPGYCRTCEGWSASYSTYDPSPAGVSLSPGYMVDVAPCPHCTDAPEARCPHCSSVLPVDDNAEPIWECACGWAEGADGKPPFGGDFCLCFEPLEEAHP